MWKIFLWKQRMRDKSQKKNSIFQNLMRLCRVTLTSLCFPREGLAWYYLYYYLKIKEYTICISEIMCITLNVLLICYKNTKISILLQGWVSLPCDCPILPLLILFSGKDSIAKYKRHLSLRCHLAIAKENAIKINIHVSH